jgi:hypothetical protein
LLASQFLITHSSADYDRARIIVDVIIAYTSDYPNGTNLGESAATLVMIMSIHRVIMFGNYETFEEAKHRFPTYFRSASRDDTPSATSYELMRSFTDSGCHEFDVAIVQKSRSSTPKIFDISSLSSLTASLTEIHPSITDWQWKKHIQVLDSIAGITDTVEMKWRSSTVGC